MPWASSPSSASGSPSTSSSARVCEPLFEGASCFPATPPGTVRVIPCMESYAGVEYDTSGRETISLEGGGQSRLHILLGSFTYSRYYVRYSAHVILRLMGSSRSLIKNSRYEAYAMSFFFPRLPLSLYLAALYPPAVLRLLVPPFLPHNVNST